VAIKEFADWILSIDDGSIGHSDDGEVDVEIPRDMLI